MALLLCLIVELVIVLVVVVQAVVIVVLRVKINNYEHKFNVHNQLELFMMMTIEK